jgi:hypothetical protein
VSFMHNASIAQQIAGVVGALVATINGKRPVASETAGIFAVMSRHEADAELITRIRTDPRHCISPSCHCMHRALLVLEIVEAIVRELGLLQSRLSDVLALAKTCRALSEPALDAIWARPPLDALARCMSRHLWSMASEPWSPRHPFRKRRLLPLVRVQSSSARRIQC